MCWGGQSSRIVILLGSDDVIDDAVRFRATSGSSTPLSRRLVKERDYMLNWTKYT